MYKDPDKQREANRLAMERYRAAERAKKRQGITNKGTSVVPCDTPDVIPKGVTRTGFGTRIRPKRTGVNLEALGIAAVPNGHGGHKLVAPIPKRGKDIKVFDDLPVDVQATIHRQSDTNVEFKKRTAIAINYQHSIGVA